MPLGARILGDLGLLADLIAAGASAFYGIRYRNRQGVTAQADFPPGGVAPTSGIVMRRYDLDRLLLDRARAFPNVTVREGFRVTGVIHEGGVVRGVEGHAVRSPARREAFRAPLTIAADGRHSIFHAACRLRRAYLARRRFGVTGHVTGLRETGPYIEVLLHPEGEIYVAPGSDGITLVALLLEESSMRWFAGDLPGRYHAFLKDAGGLRERAAASRLWGPVFAIGPLGFTVEPCHRPGLLLLGDSAGFLDPITGEGIAIALRCVVSAVPLIGSAFAAGDFGARLGQRYEEARRASIEDVFRFTRLLLRLSRHKIVADRVIRRLSRDAALFRKLLAIAAGSLGYQELSLGEKLRLVKG